MFHHFSIQLAIYYYINTMYDFSALFSNNKGNILLIFIFITIH